MRFVAVKAKKLRYAIELAPSGELTEEKGVALETPTDWSPEHLLLAALVRCSLKSLRYHGRRTGVEVRSASGSARTLVTRREDDGRYAMVETEVELRVELEPQPEANALSDLLGLAERDCFVGSSLTAKPDYRWTVNAS
jgi:organic hydroperoxide reductase OsmC/OhrA